MSERTSDMNAAELLLFRQCYPKGLVLFVYGIIFLLAVLIGLLFSDRLFSAESSTITNVIAATYASALAGGAGGATAMLVRLYQHIAAKQDFPDQLRLTYILQPIVGVVAGVLILFIVTVPATLLLNFARTGELLFGQVFVSPTQIALQLLLAWIAGFYQQQGLDKARSFLNKSDQSSDALPQDMPLVPAPLDKDDPMLYKQLTYRQKQMIRWSFTWGVSVMFYGVIWVVGLVAGYLMVGIPLLNPETASASIVVNLIWAAWPVAVAGGIGGAAGMFYDLGRHISYKQDFHRQYLMSYLVQPVVGVVFGVVMYFFIAAGYLALDSVWNPDAPAQVVDAPTVIMSQMVLGFVAGFRQQTITQLIQKLLTDLVTFLKLVGKLLLPKNLFKKANRDKVLAEIAEHSALFKSVGSGSEEDRAISNVNLFTPD